MPIQQKFDHEKLEVYQIALRFVGWTHSLLEELKSGSAPLIRETCAQLDRASLSIVLNIAEGNGRRGTKQRARFFDDSRGSATECAACLDVLVAKNVCGADRIEEGTVMLVSVVNMLSKLIARFEGGDYRVKEGEEEEEDE